MKKKDIIQLVKDTINEVGADAYGDATLTSQGQYKSRFTKTGRPPGVMEDENLKEFTDYGQEGIYPKKEKPGDMFQQKEVEDLFPHGMASRSDKAFQARVKQHADWTEQSAYNNTFVHMQYHETKGLEDEYFIYQTQHFNGNYEDFRNPKFTMLSITKNKGTEKEEDLGQYIVDTNAYIRDLNKFDEQGNLGKRVMEAPLFRTGVKMDMAPEVMAPRLKKIFDMVNGAKDPVKTPEFWKNFFRARYGFPFPERLKDINKLQALAMNKFGNDMKNKIREDEQKQKTLGDVDIVLKNVDKINNQMELEQLLSKVMNHVAAGKVTGGALALTKVLGPGVSGFVKKKFGIKEGETEDRAAAMAKVTAADQEIKAAQLALKAAQEKKKEAEMQKEGETHDHEGRMAKSQMYKMKKYVDKLSMMLGDGAQLPAWVQAKLTKASSMMSAVYHYLDYEMVRAQDNLMEHMDKYKKRATLMEGAMKKFFEMFDKGMTDEEVVREYSLRGTQIPEAFVGKARKQYEGLKRMKLELEMSETEYKNSASNIANNSENYGMEEEKQLASGLANEKLDPVGKEDDDINNDGKVDKTDKYLKNRRQAVSKAINKQKKK